MTVQSDTPLQRDFDRAEAAYEIYLASAPAPEGVQHPKFHSLSEKEIDRWLAFAPRVAIHDYTLGHKQPDDVEKYGQSAVGPSMWEMDEFLHPMNPIKQPTPTSLPTYLKSERDRVLRGWRIKLKTKLVLRVARLNHQINKL